MKLGMLFNGLVGDCAGGADRAIPALLGYARTCERLPVVGAARPRQRISRKARRGSRRSAIRYVMPTDGKTADMACWVRRIEGEQFQVFAINCAHLGCPVRWFPQSGLFMCPCHGGAYYRDGSRASGPPERGLFEYPHKIENGLITIQAGELPTPGPNAALAGEKPPCALIAQIGEWFDQRLQLAAPIREAAEHPVPRNTASWWYVFGSAALIVFLLQLVTGILLALIYVPSAGEAWSSLQALNHDVALGWFIRALHGWGSNFMVAIVLIHMVQVFLFGAYKFPRELTWIVGVFLLLMTLGMAFTGQVLRFDQDAYWGLGIGASIASRVPVVGPAIVQLMLGGPIIAGATLSRFFALHVFVIPGLLIGFVGLHLLMVLKLGINEWPMPGRVVRRATYVQRLSRADEEGRRAVRSVCHLERPVLRGVHPAGGRRMRASTSVRSGRPGSRTRRSSRPCRSPTTSSCGSTRCSRCCRRRSRRRRSSSDRSSRSSRCSCCRFSPAKARRAGGAGRSRC